MLGSSAPAHNSVDSLDTVSALFRLKQYFKPIQSGGDPLEPWVWRSYGQHSGE